MTRKTPLIATRIPMIYSMDSAIPVVAHVKILTSTMLILMTADTGPVGPSLRAKKTQNSAPRENRAATRPQVMFSLLKNSWIGI